MSSYRSTTAFPSHNSSSSPLPPPPSFPTSGPSPPISAAQLALLHSYAASLEQQVAAEEGMLAAMRRIDEEALMLAVPSTSPPSPTLDQRNTFNDSRRVDDGASRKFSSLSSSLFPPSVPALTYPEVLRRLDSLETSLREEVRLLELTSIHGARMRPPIGAVSAVGDGGGSTCASHANATATSTATSASTTTTRAMAAALGRRADGSPMLPDFLARNPAYPLPAPTLGLTTASAGTSTVVSVCSHSNSSAANHHVNHSSPSAVSATNSNSMPTLVNPITRAALIPESLPEIEALVAAERARLGRLMRERDYLEAQGEALLATRRR